jgi:hypothetical protein
MSTTADPAMTSATLAERAPQLSDAGLIAAVGAILATPRRDEADSFVLHSPLELVARAALLPYVRPVQRDLARRRLVALADGFESSGPPVAPPADTRFDSLDAAVSRLRAGLGAGDLDDVDAASAWIGAAATPPQLRTLLADEIVPRLAAAAHGPIFLYQLPRVAPRGELSGVLVRTLVRELARNPDWRLHWIDARPARRPVPAAAVFDAIADAPRLGLPGSDFIYPIMSQAERHGGLTELLGAPIAGVAVEDAARQLLRAAALSMLHEPDDYAPYGWSHCLTMPQAVLGIADACDDPRRAVAVAATYVAGFRTALASRPLTATFTPPDVAMTVADALDAAPWAAAAAAWHTPARGRGEVVAELATRAATHRDAHLVKYTLACLDAAAWDSGHAALYLAAAADLHSYWVRHGDPGDPFDA